jgi:hypothetical protein
MTGMLAAMDLLRDVVPILTVVVLAVVGVVAFLAVRRMARKEQSDVERKVEVVTGKREAGEVLLPPVHEFTGIQTRTTPRNRMVTAGIGAAITIVFAVISAMYLSRRARWGSDTTWMYLGTYAMAGVAAVMFLHWVYTLMLMYLPRPRLRLRPDAVRYGGELTVEWWLDGNTAKMKSLDIVLAAVRPDASMTFGRALKSFTLVSVTGDDQFAHGWAVCTLPTEDELSSMPVDPAWKIRVVGRRKRWPHLKEEYPFDLLVPDALIPLDDLINAAAPPPLPPQGPPNESA